MDLHANIERISSDLTKFKEQNKTLFLSTSLQTHSLPLVHIIHNFDPNIPVYFIDTGYHFPETIKFKNRLKKEYGFNIVEVRSTVSRINQRDASGNLLYASDPDYCCYLNKVKPLEPVLKKHDVWISGVRASQTAHRSSLDKIENGKFNTLHYHPILEWSSKMIHTYRVQFDLPEHPLEKKGYFSVGCMPCTRKIDLRDESNDRSSRWFGLNKNECGIHTDTK